MQILVWVLLQLDISDLIRLSPWTYIIIYEFCSSCFKVEYKRSYISNETLKIAI